MAVVEREDLDRAVAVSDLPWTQRKKRNYTLTTSWRLAHIDNPSKVVMVWVHLGKVMVSWNNGTEHARYLDIATAFAKARELTGR